MSIDKDLFSRGAKEYSPKTCCFVPSTVNIAEKNHKTLQYKKRRKQTKPNMYCLKTVSDWFFNPNKRPARNWAYINALWLFAIGEGVNAKDMKSSE